MADGTTSRSFPITSGDRLAEVAWSQVTHVEVKEETFFAMNGMVAQDRGREDAFERRPGVPVILKDDLRRAPGEQVTIRMRMQLTYTPRANSTTYGANSMLGAEEAMAYRDLQVYLDVLKHSVAHDSPDFYYHRTSIDLEQDAEDLLKEWLIDQHEEAILDAFYDKSPYFVYTDLSQSAVAHPHIYYAGGADGPGAMDSTRVLNAAETRRMRSFFINRRLNPIRIDGGKYACVLADTFVCNDLRADPNYITAQQANTQSSDNPMITGSIGAYNNLLFYEYERMRRVDSGVNGPNIARVAMLGADSIAVAYGSEPRLVSRAETNYGDRWGRAVRQVFGASRCDFRNQAASATTNQSSAEWRVWEERDEFAQ